MINFDERIVADPKVFEQNSLAPHSDHDFFPNEEAYYSGKNPFKVDLNGFWKFSYARNPKAAIADFYEKDYDCHEWDVIRVPAHIQMEGYDTPQYANTQYPWDGHDVIEPGEIPTNFNPTASYVKYFYLPEDWKAWSGWSRWSDFQPPPSVADRCCAQRHPHPARTAPDRSLLS